MKQHSIKWLLSAISIVFVFCLFSAETLAATCGSFNVTPSEGPPGTAFTVSGSNCLLDIWPGDSFYLRLENADGIQIGPLVTVASEPQDPAADTTKNHPRKFMFSFSNLNAEGNYTLTLLAGSTEAFALPITSTQIEITPTGAPNLGARCGDVIGGTAQPPECDPTAGIINNCCPSICPGKLGRSGLSSVWICTPVVEYACSNTRLGGEGILSAIGCVPISNINRFVTFMITWSLPVAGGVAFLLMIIAAYQIITARGIPEKYVAGKELLTAAISGLLFIIFSIFIFRIIAQNFLGIL